MLPVLSGVLSRFLAPFVRGQYVQQWVTYQTCIAQFLVKILKSCMRSGVSSLSDKTDSLWQLWDFNSATAYAMRRVLKRVGRNWLHCTRCKSIPMFRTNSLQHPAQCLDDSTHPFTGFLNNRWSYGSVAKGKYFFPKWIMERLHTNRPTGTESAKVGLTFRLSVCNLNSLLCKVAGENSKKLILTKLTFLKVLVRRKLSKESVPKSGKNATTLTLASRTKNT